MKIYHYVFAVVLPFSMLVDPAIAGDADETTTQEYKAGDYVDDATITSRVKLDLIKEDSLKASKIHVETTSGVVHLNGEVGSPAQESKAVNIARNVKGVKAVREDLAINGGLE